MPDVSPKTQEKPTYYAYLRVSTHQQDVDNQKLGVMDYANAKGFTPLILVEDTVSGRTPWEERGIGELVMHKAKSGDVIVASEVSRLGRSTLQVLQILEVAARKKISVHLVKSQMVMDGSMQSQITATILGLAAQIERQFISERTKEALRQRKASGQKLGRPKGQAENLLLDNRREEILGYLRKGVTKANIARIIECAPSTLYEWLKRRNIKVKT